MILPYLAAALLAVATVYSAVVSFRPTSKREGALSHWIFPDHTNRPARIFVGIATLILLIGLGAWFKINVFSTNARNPNPRSFRFLIPEGYSGWVRIEFEIPGAPPLPFEGGQTVLEIPPSGMLRTSSPEQYGWARDEYVLYSNHGMRPLSDSGPGRLIWGKINGEQSGHSGTRKYEEFFVGSQQQFKDQATQARPEALPKNSHSPAATP
jgi:hypothetical protein